MNANIVYSVAKALPQEEQRKLLQLLEDDIRSTSIKKVKKEPLISRAEVDAYILKYVFNCR